MREIKFRGHTGACWVYGNLIQYQNSNGKACTQIEETKWDDFGCWDVDPESVGQFTGLVDKAGVDIFEGDIVRIWTRSGWGYEADVGFNDGCFDVEPEWRDCLRSHVGNHSVRVIGNVFEHPEPLICPAHKECNLKNHACNAGLCPWRIKDLTTT